MYESFDQITNNLSKPSSHPKTRRSRASRSNHIPKLECQGHHDQITYKTLEPIILMNLINKT